MQLLDWGPYSLKSIRWCLFYFLRDINLTQIAYMWIVNLFMLFLNTYLHVSILLTVGTGETVDKDKESSKPHGKTKTPARSTLLQISCYSVEPKKPLLSRKLFL